MSRQLGDDALLRGRGEVRVVQADRPERLRRDQRDHLVGLWHAVGHTDGRGGRGQDHVTGAVLTGDEASRPGGRPGGDPVVDDDRDDAREPGERVTRPQLLDAPGDRRQLAPFHVGQGVGSQAAVPQHGHVDDPDAALTDRAQRELRLPGQGELADQGHVERSTERLGDAGGNGHPASRQTQHHEPVLPAQRGRETFAQLPSGIVPVGERRAPCTHHAYDPPVSDPAHPQRTTVLVGLLLAILLVVAYAVVSWSATPPAPAPLPTPFPPFPTPPRPSDPPPPDAPTQGAGYPVHKVGALTDRSVLVNGRGNADLRYRRTPHNGTRLHFVCTGCDADTWLVEEPRGNPIGGGPLTEPNDTIWALDTVEPGVASSLLVKAPVRAVWTVTLTPFDAIPVHEQTFDALGDDVIAVRARSELQITCGGAAFVRTLARGAADPEYAVVQLRQEDAGGTWGVSAPTGTDLLVMMVSCPGRWTVTVPG